MWQSHRETLLMIVKKKKKKRQTKDKKMLYLHFQLNVLCPPPIKVTHNQ